MIKTMTKNQRAGRKAFKTKLLQAINSKDPADILQLSTDIRQREYDWEYLCDRESIICKAISQTTWASFCRFGDRNQATEALILKWIRNNGEPLDVQCIWIESDTGLHVTPSELAQFITRYDRGCQEYHYHRRTNELKKIFKEVTGFNWSHEIHNIIEVNVQPVDVTH